MDEDKAREKLNRCINILLARTAVKVLKGEEPEANIKEYLQIAKLTMQKFEKFQRSMDDLENNHLYTLIPESENNSHSDNEVSSLSGSDQKLETAEVMSNPPTQTESCSSNQMKETEAANSSGQNEAGSSDGKTEDKSGIRNRQTKRGAGSSDTRAQTAAGSSYRQRQTEANGSIPRPDDVAKNGKLQPKPEEINSFLQLSNTIVKHSKESVLEKLAQLECKINLNRAETSGVMDVLRDLEIATEVFKQVMCERTDSTEEATETE